LISILFPFFFLPYVLAAGSLLRPGRLLLRRSEKMAARERQSEGLRKVLSAKGSRQGKENCRESRWRQRDAVYLREVMTNGRTGKIVLDKLNIDCNVGKWGNKFSCMKTF
jgi:hypothetical protein